MRHRIEKKKMGRTAEHRQSLAKNLASELILHERVNTTLEKAKFVKPFVEKIITKAKKSFRSEDKVVLFNTVKTLKRELGNDSAVKKLIGEIAERFHKRPGGYTRIIKTGNRVGDNAKTARIELLPSETKDAPIKEANKKGEKKPAEKKDKKGKVNKAQNDKQ
ncbi:MAG: hypothetical protein KatS3mg101_0240 [Patescibacteria group bacterium]|nr:MAG: hypothetical protein KatS3mg101_0240 [Patescibacteria group bacterium]